MLGILLAINAAADNAPSRIQLLPPGPTIVGVDGRAWRMEDAEGVASATNGLGRELVVDENHSTDKQGPGTPAPAVGWIGSVAVANDGSVWGQVAWNERGKKLITERSYRFISPVFSYDEQTGAIERIVGAGLVNRPNLELQALNAQENNMKIAASILTALGLPATADEAQVLQAINAKEAAPSAATTPGVDLTQYAPRADLALMEQRAVNAEQRLQALEAEGVKRRATAAVEAAVRAHKIAPASKDAYLAMCASEAGLKQFEAIVAASPAIVPDGAVVPAGAPESTLPAANAEQQAEDARIARQLGIASETTATNSAEANLWVELGRRLGIGTNTRSA